MKSKNDIRLSLQSIASSYNLEGTSVNLLVDLLTNALYNEQVAQVNTLTESSLDRATLDNSKIQQSADRFYSVYRGSCPTSVVTLIPTSILEFTKYGIAYESNSFKLYSIENKVVYPNPNPINLNCIIAKERLITNLIITEATELFIDILENDLTEDVMVLIEGSEVKTTRIFTEQVRLSTPSDPIIFIMTIPGFGIRLYHPYKFLLGSTVSITNFVRTELSTLNASELASIRFQGVSSTVLINTPEKAYENMRYVLNKANESVRLDSMIKSNSDISNLFDEVFKDKVIESTTLFYPTYIDLIYIPIGSSLVSPTEFSNFLSTYKTYYVSNTINLLKATQAVLKVDVEVISADSAASISKINSIFDEYKDKLNVEILNNKVISLIAKIPEVKYTNSLSITERLEPSPGVYTYVPYVPSVSKYLQVILDVIVKIE